MRVVLIFAAAVMFGLAGGYAWSAFSAPKPHVHVPKARTALPPPVPESAADKHWTERAEDKPAPAAAAPAATSAQETASEGAESNS